MRTIIAITQLTVDGVMQSPGGPEEDPSSGFAHGGWQLDLGPELDEAIAELIAGEFDMLLGRRTYDIFAGYWPDQESNPIGKAFNKATKYVVTGNSGHLDWTPSRPISGDVVDEVRRLKASTGPALHIWGSGKLLQTLMAADLVDEFRLWVYPVIVGYGQRLFENGIPARRLTLVESRGTPRGVLVLTYRAAGPLPLPKTVG
jgi:dihydrofolate reductase